MRFPMSVCIVLGLFTAGPGRAGSAPAGAGPRGAALPVPFRLAQPDKPLILLDAMVNGTGPHRFVLDTGAGITILSPGLARTLELELKAPEQAVGAGGAVEVRFARVDSFAVGDSRLADLRVGVMPLEGIAQAIGSDLDGIVGYNFLSAFRVLIDYPGHTVTFEPAPASTP